MSKKEYNQGVITVGGCGTSVLHDVVDMVNPAGYPHFLLFGGNTDAADLSDKFEEPGKDGNVDEKLDAWGNNITLVQFGDDKTTQGFGAGGDPEVGREAAGTEQSREYMRKFIEKCDGVILVGAVGGGTGTYALSVAADICLELKIHTVLAIVVTPFEREGRTKEAIEGREELRQKVPIICIENDHLEQYVSDLTNEEAEKVKGGFLASRRMINKLSIVPMLKILREIIQVPGDAKNLDPNDYRALLKVGRYVA
ncbi:hypothetical protein KW807_01235 [Candidatus Parcubacteria bacterium]|nr:hypothetical protein [Candidatus Parcubacteria bacterium]